jgi:hypothetical protein
MHNCTSILHSTIDGLYPVPVDHVTSIGKNGNFFILFACYGYESRLMTKYIDVLHMHSATYTYVDMINWTWTLNTDATWKNDDFEWRFENLKWYNFWMKRVDDEIIACYCVVVFVLYMHVYSLSVMSVFKLIQAKNRRIFKILTFSI